jgi:aminopeptidase N
MTFTQSLPMQTSQIGLVAGYFEILPIKTEPFVMQAYCLPGKSAKASYILEYASKVRWQSLG